MQAADRLVTPERSMALPISSMGAPSSPTLEGTCVPSAAQVRGQVASIVEAALLECQQPEADSQPTVHRPTITAPAPTYLLTYRPLPPPTAPATHLHPPALSLGP